MLLRLLPVMQADAVCLRPRTRPDYGSLRHLIVSGVGIVFLLKHKAF